MKEYIITHIKLVCLALMTLSVSSCMDLEPKAQLGDNLVWDKADNFQLFANQFYGWTRDFQMSADYDYGNGFSDGPHSDYRSDLIATSSINTYSQGTNTIPASDKNYTEIYKRIYYTNLLLDKANSFGDKDAIAIPIGEAKFFRAYLHFELVQIWGDVILLTKPLDLDSEELQAPRNDRSIVIDQIITDLQEAAVDLPETASEAGRLTKYAALAMISRVALYEGTWQKFHSGGYDTSSNTIRSTELLNIAKDAANDVITGNKYQLFYNSDLGNNSYRYMFILEDAAQCNPANLMKKDNTEYILAHRHRDGDRMINITHAAQANVVFVTRKLANMYVCSDGLPISKSPLFKGYTGVTDEFQNRDMRMDNTLLQNGQNYWNNDGKWRITWDSQDLNNSLVINVRSNSGYQNNKWAVERQVADYNESIDYPVIRYAEVLLNYAEAVYELNGSISDTELDYSLNLVRQRINKDMPKLSNSFVSANGLSMREEIRRERTVELFLEGFRIDDLKRWANASIEMKQDQLGVKFTGTWFEANWSAQSRQLNSEGCIILYDSRNWEDKHYLYPLPSDQRQLNPQLGQNPGWTN